MERNNCRGEDELSVERRVSPTFHLSRTRTFAGTVVCCVLVFGCFFVFCLVGLVFLVVVFFSVWVGDLLALKIPTCTHKRASVYGFMVLVLTKDKKRVSESEIGFLTTICIFKIRYGVRFKKNIVIWFPHEN